MSQKVFIIANSETLMPSRCRFLSRDMALLLLLSDSLNSAAILKSKSLTLHPLYKLELCRGAGHENKGIKMTTKPVKSTAVSQIKPSQHKLLA